MVWVCIFICVLIVFNCLVFPVWCFYVGGLLLGSVVFVCLVLICWFCCLAVFVSLMFPFRCFFGICLGLIHLLCFRLIFVNFRMLVLVILLQCRDSYFGFVLF